MTFGQKNHKGMVLNYCRKNTTVFKDHQEQFYVGGANIRYKYVRNEVSTYKIFVS